jgi:hypothetical protein
MLAATTGSLHGISLPIAGAVEVNDHFATITHFASITFGAATTYGRWTTAQSARATGRGPTTAIRFASGIATVVKPVTGDHLQEKPAASAVAGAPSAGTGAPATLPAAENATCGPSIISTCL